MFLPARLLRMDIVTLGCSSGNIACLTVAAGELQAWIDDQAYALPLGTTRQVSHRHTRHVRHRHTAAAATSRV